MNKEKRRVPKLRFPGFTEDWEQRKLGDIATITGGGTPSTNISEYWNGDIDWYSPVEIGENRYVSRSTRKITKLGLEKSSAKILPVGTVLFTSRAGIGNTAILQAEGCTNQGFQSITPNSKELDTYFLYTMTPKLKRYGEVTGAGSTFVEVSGKQMEQMNLMIPSLEEQKHVSQLFELMDDAITLHQRKLEHLKLKKKALLQKLFPKNGERYPELRFPGFTDAWEQRKLGECVDISTGYPFDSQDFNENGEYLVITNSNIQENTPFVLNNIGNRIDLDDSLKKYILDIDDLLITMDGTVGRVAIVVDTKLVLAQRVCRIKSNEPYYIYQLLSKNNFIQSMNKIGHGGTIKHISLSEISEYQAFYPKSQKERIKISSVLTNYDKLITLHQRKLGHLQLQKKALLQQMFV